MALRKKCLVLLEESVTTKNNEKLKVAIKEFKFLQQQTYRDNLADPSTIRKNEEIYKRNQKEGYSESEEEFEDPDRDDKAMVVKLDGIIKDIERNV